MSFKSRPPRWAGASVVVVIVIVVPAAVAPLVLIHEGMAPWEALTVCGAVATFAVGFARQVLALATRPAR